MNTSKGKSKGWAILMFLPFLLMFIMFWVAPVFYGLYMSFHKYSVFAGNSGFVGFENYISVLSPGNIYSNRFYNGLNNTMIFVMASVPALIAISLFLALLINNLKGKLQVIFRTIFFISYSVSVTAVSAIFLWLFNGNGGYINNVFSSLGLPGVSWINSQPAAWVTILITTIWWTIGYNMILFINALDEVDHSLYEAAGLDGANAWEQFKYITFPSIRNVFLFVMLTTVISSFNLYGQSLLITGGGPSQSTETLTMIIQQVVFNQNNLGLGSAMAIIMGFIMMLITGVQYYITYRGGDK